MNPHHHEIHLSRTAVSDYIEDIGTARADAHTRLQRLARSTNRRVSLRTPDLTALAYADPSGVVLSKIDVTETVRDFRPELYAPTADHERIAMQWIAHNFDDATVQHWLSAGVWAPDVAMVLRDAGVHPDALTAEYSPGTTLATGVSHGWLAPEDVIRRCA